MDQQVIAGIEIGLEPTTIRWRAGNKHSAEDIGGTARTRSWYAATITAAVEILHATAHYGLAVRTWGLSLWDGSRWGKPRTLRILQPTRWQPWRVWIVGIGHFDKSGNPLRERRPA